MTKSLKFGMAKETAAKIEVSIQISWAEISFMIPAQPSNHHPRIVGLKQETDLIHLYLVSKLTVYTDWGTVCW